MLANQINADAVSNTNALPPRRNPAQLLRGTERYVDSLNIQVLPGCSHWVQQDQPQEVNRRMREFLPPRSKQ